VDVVIGTLDVADEFENDEKEVSTPLVALEEDPGMD
jgi:hypothetical protein